MSESVAAKGSDAGIEARIETLEQEVQDIRSGGGLLGWGAACGFSVWLGVVAFCVLVDGSAIKRFASDIAHADGKTCSRKADSNPELPILKPVSPDSKGNDSRQPVTLPDHRAGLLVLDSLVAPDERAELAALGWRAGAISHNVFTGWPIPVALNSAAPDSHAGVPQ